MAFNEEYEKLRNRNIKAKELTSKMSDEEFRTKMFDAIIPKLKEKGVTAGQIASNNVLLLNLYIEYDFNTESDHIVKTFLEKYQ